MPSTKLILVTGAPATGKTTLAKRIAERFALPLICKDDIKEILFDTVGWSDRAWSRKLGIATYGVMYYVLKSQLLAGRSLVMESDFRPEFDEPKLLQLKKEFSFHLFSLHCHADTQVVLARFQERVNGQQRHPGHVDTENYKIFTAEMLAKDFPNFTIGEDAYELNTTDFAAIDYEGLWKRITAFLAQIPT